jgi:hypothetical protein
MRFVLDRSHCDFFAKHGYIAFSDLFPPKSIRRAAEAVTQTAQNGWQTVPAIKQLTLHEPSADIAGQLTKSRTIRLAYDCVLSGPDPSLFSDLPLSFTDFSCIRPLLCILIIRLTNGASYTSDTPYCPCPEEEGEALFVSSTKPLILSPLLSLPDQKFLLIAYTNKGGQYIPNGNDPISHILKAQGCGFGDRLTKSPFHPLLYPKQ